MIRRWPAGHVSEFQTELITTAIGCGSTSAPLRPLARCMLHEDAPSNPPQRCDPNAR